MVESESVEVRKAKEPVQQFWCIQGYMRIISDFFMFFLCSHIYDNSPFTRFAI